MWTTSLGMQIRARSSMPSDSIASPAQNQRKTSASISDWNGVVEFNELRPAAALADNHFLGRFINKAEVLSERDLITILSDERIDLALSGFDCGTIPASTNPDSSYSRHAWTRDAAIAACALRRVGDLGRAGLVVSNLARFYSREEQRERFIRFHFDPAAPENYQRGETLPLIRSKIDHSGEMVRFRTNPDGHVEDAEAWGHQQLDAIAEWLWITFRMANRGELNIRRLNASLSDLNPNNNVESIFSAALVFLERIECWNRGDLGMWEEPPTTRRASSLLMLTSALREARQYFQTHGWDVLMNQTERAEPESRLRLERAVTSTHDYLFEALKHFIPDTPDGMAYESIDHDGNKRIDSAMLVGIYPFDAGLSDQQKRSILRACYQLKGEVGFSRYRGDPYVGQDYIHSRQPYHMADPSSPNYREAPWLLFDATAAGFYFREFENGGGRDPMLRQLGDAHLKRALSMLTSQKHSYTIAENGEQIEIDIGTPPEALFFDTKAGVWRPNHNSPLNWSKAALALALERALTAAEISPVTHSWIAKILSKIRPKL